MSHVFQADVECVAIFLPGFHRSEIYIDAVEMSSRTHDICVKALIQGDVYLTLPIDYARFVGCHK